MHQEPMFNLNTGHPRPTVENALKLSDLVEPSGIQLVMRDIHNHLAANATNMTRPEKLSQQMINILFCKLYDEINAKNSPLFFQHYLHETPSELKNRLRDYFEKKVKLAYSEAFDKDDKIQLDADSLAYVVSHLQSYRIAGAKRDVIGDAFEAILGYHLKGSKGQFFTPRNVVKMMVEIIDPQPGEKILDPACGSGGFLVMALMYIESIKKIKSLHNSEQTFPFPSTTFVGVDKDRYLAKVTNAYMQILGTEQAHIFSENSLDIPSQWSETTRQELKYETFDVILTNPPFGAKLRIKDQEILSQFDLAHKWRSIKSGKFNKTRRIVHTPPQILFIERCLDFLREDGRLGIVLPESLFGNPSYGYIMQYLQESTQFEAILSMPEELFQPYTHAKSCILITRKGKSQKREYKFFMGIADWCGHDSRGNPTIRQNPHTGEKELLDDIPKLTQRYKALMHKEENNAKKHLGFLIKCSEIQDNIFVPKYYDPDIEESLSILRSTHNLVTVNSLIESGIISVKTGVEVGRMAYGTGTIPFVRTSDISNWEIKIDPKHCVSEEVYRKYKHRADVKSGDILLVRDGTYLVGTSCIITDYDTKILFQSHIYRIRIHKPQEMDPYLIFTALNSPIVKKQIRAKQFTQHIIDTLGSRIEEIILPLPKDVKRCQEIARETRQIVETRARLRQKAKDISLHIQSTLNL